MLAAREQAVIEHQVAAGVRRVIVDDTVDTALPDDLQGISIVLLVEDRALELDGIPKVHHEPVFRTGDPHNGHGVPKAYIRSGAT